MLSSPNTISEKLRKQQNTSRSRETHAVSARFFRQIRFLRKTINYARRPFPVVVSTKLVPKLTTRFFILHPQVITGHGAAPSETTAYALRTTHSAKLLSRDPASHVIISLALCNYSSDSNNPLLRSKPIFPFQSTFPSPSVCLTSPSSVYPQSTRPKPPTAPYRANRVRPE